MIECYLGDERRKITLLFHVWELEVWKEVAEVGEVGE
jgi:hypothetical protein